MPSFREAIERLENIPVRPEGAGVDASDLVMLLEYADMETVMWLRRNLNGLLWRGLRMEQEAEADK